MAIATIALLSVAFAGSLFLPAYVAVTFTDWIGAERALWTAAAATEVAVFLEVFLAALLIKTMATKEGEP